MATNISHWLKVYSRWFKNYICKIVYFDQLLDFQILFLLFLLTLYYCAIFFSLDAGFFQYHPGVKQFGSRSGWTFCQAWSGSKLFARVISRQQNFWLDLDSNYLQSFKQTTKEGKVLNTKKKLFDAAFWLKPWLNKVISFGYNFFHLAKVLATTNSEPELPLAWLHPTNL